MLLKYSSILKQQKMYLPLFDLVAHSLQTKYKYLMNPQIFNAAVILTT